MARQAITCLPALCADELAPQPALHDGAKPASPDDCCCLTGSLARGGRRSEISIAALARGKRCDSSAAAQGCAWRGCWGGAARRRGICCCCWPLELGGRAAVLGRGGWGEGRRGGCAFCDVDGCTYEYCCARVLLYARRGGRGWRRGGCRLSILHRLVRRRIDFLRACVRVC